MINVGLQQLFVVDVERSLAVLLGLESVFNQNSGEKILSVTHALIRFFTALQLNSHSREWVI